MKDGAVTDFKLHRLYVGPHEAATSVILFLGLLGIIYSAALIDQPYRTWWGNIFLFLVLMGSFVAIIYADLRYPKYSALIIDSANP